MLPYQTTPVQDISHHPSLLDAGVRVLVKREDLNHPEVSGNKWWKLKYNLERALEEGHDTILTFGGAWSNHIYATAAAATAMRLKSIGIIRGEETLPLNPTLRFAVDHGMKLQYVERHVYRNKHTSAFLQDLRERWGKFYLVPEGGTNDLAVKGCEEFGRMLSDIPADYVCLAVGTGGTMAGIVRSISPRKKVLGFPVLKNGSFLEPIIRQLAGDTDVSWQLMTEFAYGGYGKPSQIVSDFIKDFFARTGIPLDFVYTGKVMSGIFELVKQGYFQKGQTILAIHTGGIHGDRRWQMEKVQ